MPEFNYHFENRKEYFENLADDIGKTKSGDMITVASMELDAREPLVMAVMEELGSAAMREVDVAVAIDAYSFLKNAGIQPSPLWYPGKIEPGHLRQPFRANYAALENIRNSGGTYRITNQPGLPFSLAIAGRSHIKGAVIRSRQYAPSEVRVRIGGHNLNHPTDLDIMAVSDNELLATRLENLIRGNIADGSVRHHLKNEDQHYHITDATDMFVDAGVRGQSIIQDKAIQLIDETEDGGWIFMTCQYFPGGRIGQHLKAAQEQRKVNVQVAYSPPSTHGFLEQYGHQIYNFLESIRLPKNFTDYELDEGLPKLHAKLLANSKGGMLGSHNYVDQGVRLGTAEIAIHVRDPEFSKAAITAITAQMPFGHNLD